MTASSPAIPDPSAAAARAGALWTPSPRVLAILLGVLLAVIVATFWNFLSAQVRFAIRHPADWGHTLIIPGIAASFVWMCRKELLAEPFRPAWTGLPILAAGVGLYILCTFGPSAFALHHNARGFAFGISLFGLCLLLFGWRAMRHLWFPIAYVVVFGQTVTDRILNVVTFRLQDISARGAEVVLNLIGVDTDRAGNTLTVWKDGMPHPLNVAEACSGMRMLLAFLALGVAIAYTGLKRPWQRVALVLLGVPVAVAVNVLRVVSLGGLSMIDSDLTSGEFHNFVGLVWLVPALMIFLGIMWILRRMVIEQPTTIQSSGTAS